MFEVAAIYLVVVALAIFADWRRGLTIVALTTIVQDPLRKLTPDQPVALSLMAGVVVVITLIASLRTPTPRDVEYSRGYRALVAAAIIFVAMIGLQAVNGFLWHGSVFAVALGILTYLGPLPAILVGRRLARLSGDAAIMRFLKSYLLLTIPAVCTIYLQYSGVDWAVLGDVGNGIQMYDVLLNGAPLGTFGGLFRSSEIAAWHICACCCFVTLVLSYRNISTRSLLLCAAIVAALLALGVVTGRRKLIIEVAVFLAAYVFLIALIGKIGLRLWIAVGFALAAVGFVASSLENYLTSDAVYRQFLARGRTGFTDAADRFQQLGLEPLVWAYNRFGPFGGGVGAATAGAQNYGVDANMVAVGEGGLGKLAGELGWPGLAAGLCLLVLLARHVLKMTHFAAAESMPEARLRCGLAAFLIANFSVFSVATQVFNDLFVLTTLGLCVGALISNPRHRTRWRQETATADALAPEGALGT